ncbi:MAG: VanZ family protein [Tenacibaculum sp.]|nr:VanZ family protein [Tenacibaculum sp.]
MLMLIKKLLQGKIIYLAIITTVAIAILSLMKVEKPDVRFSNFDIDKIGHTIAYFVLGFLWLIALHKKGMKFAVILGVTLYGILMEVLQSVLTDYRTFELMDMLANTMGVFLALIAFLLIEKKQFKLLNSL